eukprot:TRINITY_DN2340_c3_g1_i2.p1 TRINITY_DN2340_c3_g1~~TRINITY_DN2340_c3_g1_i2.p1  ORF type:complete len:964 (+),score=128.78 TRINITY_DN2340_c3_g1_i2:59-2893(+)
MEGEEGGDEGGGGGGGERQVGGVGGGQVARDEEDVVEDEKGGGGRRGGEETDEEGLDRVVSDITGGNNGVGDGIGGGGIGNDVRQKNLVREGSEKGAKQGERVGASERIRRAERFGGEGDLREGIGRERRQVRNEDLALKSRCVNAFARMWGGVPLKWGVGQLSPRTVVPQDRMCERNGELIPCEENPSGALKVTHHGPRGGPTPGGLMQATKPQQRFAYAFLLFSPELLRIAVVAAQCLRLTGTSHDILLLTGGAATLNNLGPEHLFLISTHFTSMRPVASIRNPYTHSAYSKLHAWALTDYTRVVYLDLDILVLENVDSLFQHPGMAAVPDVYESHKFNSGVLVLDPSLETYSRMVTAAGNRASYNKDDQGFLNPFFDSWYSMDAEHRLPFKYNAILHFPPSYTPPAGLDVNRAHLYLGPLAIVHFANPWFKPWKSRNTSECSVWCSAWLSVYDELDRNGWKSLDPDRFQVLLDWLPDGWVDGNNPHVIRRRAREEARRKRGGKEEETRREGLGKGKRRGEVGSGDWGTALSPPFSVQNEGSWGVGKVEGREDETSKKGRERGESEEKGGGEGGEGVLPAGDFVRDSEKIRERTVSPSSLALSSGRNISAEATGNVSSQVKSVDLTIPSRMTISGTRFLDNQQSQSSTITGLATNSSAERPIWLWQREKLSPPIQERYIAPRVRKGYEDDAFATLLMNPNETFLAGTWGLSYRQHHRLGKGGPSMRPALLLVLSTVPEESWLPYKALFADILVVEPLQLPGSDIPLPPEFAVLALWDQLRYERIVFVEALSLFWDNCNGLFDWEPFAAAPCALPGDRFNWRTMLIRPDERTFQDMVAKLSSPQYPTDTIDHFLNAYFHTWYTSAAPHRLPLTYAVDTMLKPHSIKYIHPWKVISFDERVPPFGDVSAWHGQPRIIAVQRWREVFCRLRTKLRPPHFKHLCND